jgi:predicted SnoaL-like aldol condensation-catalyzing enzyme
VEKIMFASALPMCLLAACLTLPAQAQEPVTGVADPESLFTDKDPVKHRNKQASLHIMRELLQCHYWNDAGKWMTEKYIQHNPNTASGLKASVEYFVNVVGHKPTPTCDKLTRPITAVMADGDLVTVMLPRSYPHPTKPGTTYTSTWYNTWRFVDGKADEHWDPATLGMASNSAVKK